MCGIVGYVGQQSAARILIDSLKRLEYRGYDSAGICEVNGRLQVEKTKGRINDLELIVGGVQFSGTVGVGHTRWATHGAPSDANAHPHLDCTEEIAVVHNGIIENYQELRKSLLARGHHFRSQTDTEVVSHLVEEYYQGDLLMALRNALGQLKGSYAVVVVSKQHPNQLVVARYDSPLVIGLGKGENYVASDIPAIIEYTRDIYVLEDGEIASITPNQVEVFCGESLVEKEVFHVDWDPVQARKEGYPDFMLKEIHEQPKAVRDTLLGRISETGVITLEEEIPDRILEGVTNLQLTACGTAYHACLYGKALLAEFLDLPIESELASEYRYQRVRANQNTLMIVVSQSGETADTLGAMRLAKRKGARVIGITNVVGSTLSREADAVLYTHAGPEIAVASTKAYTTQLALLALLAMYLTEKIGTGQSGLTRQLQAIPEQMETILAAHEYRLQQFAQEIKDVSDMFYLGRGLDYASAMEGQLKLKEISYIHGEALAGGELKHGTLALIEPGIPVIALATQTRVISKMISNLEEVKARGGQIVLFTCNNQGDYSEIAEQQFILPMTDPLLASLLTAVPLQLLAYHTAKARGLDVDKPRNLAKSVTVE